MNRKKTLSILFLFVFPLILSAKNPSPIFVKIETTMGNIKVMLYDDTPLHRDNFVKLVDSHFYDGLLFHRVIKGFMIQGGDPNSRNCDSTTYLGDGDVGYTIPAEIKFPEHYHKRGALCAARTGDDENPERASSGCQFYIVVGKTYTDEQLTKIENDLNKDETLKEPILYSKQQRLQYETFGGVPYLDTKYTVFGEVVEGYSVLDRISQVETGKNNRPKQDVRIIKMKVVKR